MPRLSLNMDEELHQRLLIYAIKTTGKAHGVKEQIILGAIESYLDTNESAAPAVECVVSSGEVPVTAKPIKKPNATKTRKSKKKDPAVMKLIQEAWNRSPRPSTRQIADEIKTTLGVSVAHVSVGRYARELGLQTEETEPETANVGE